LALLRIRIRIKNQCGSTTLGREELLYEPLFRTPMRRGAEFA
jgi:hypothetical protein